MHRQHRPHHPRGRNACNRPCNGPSSAFWRTSASRPGAAEHGIHWRHVCRPLPCDLPFVQPSQCLRGRGRIAAGNLLVHADPDPGLGARTHSRRRTRPALCLPSLRPNASAPRHAPLSLSALSTAPAQPAPLQPQPRSHVLPYRVARAPRHWVNAGVFPLTPITKRSTSACYSARPKSSGLDRLDAPHRHPKNTSAAQTRQASCTFAAQTAGAR